MRTVQSLESQNSNDEQEDCYSLEYVSEISARKLMTKLELELNGYKESIICQIDTGATVNVLNFADLCKIMQDGNPSLKPSYIKLRCYGGEILKPRGQIKINCSHQSKQHPIVFQVIDHWEKPILSAETCQKLNLIEIKADLCQIESTWTKQNNLLDKYKDIFEGIGCLQGEYKLETDPTIKPIKQAPRRVPITLRKELKEKLIDMEKKNIIAKVDYPTDWISNLVLVKSTKKLRICIDPRELNVALKRAEYPIPTIEEIIPNLQNAKIFTVVDTKDGFWNVKLSDESSNLTTFWTPFGRYKFLRMPFGLKTASEEYQRRLYEIFQGLEGIEIIADDILILGKGDSYEEALKDHDRNLENLFKTARQANLKFNINKVKLRLKEVKYLRHIITPHGLKPDPENEPLRKLTMKNSTWSWSKNHQAAFEQIKDLASKAPILRYFDADKSIAIQCDASKHGLGATLLQESQPIIFASRSLSKTEQNYAQIEKECLAIVFACERFHQYILGKCQVIVQNDHKPLLSIFKKSILKAPQRLQRMLLRLQRYNLELEHVQGSQMHLADIFSRACIKDVRNENLKYDVYPIDIIYKEIATVNVMETLSVCSDTVLRIREETSSDPILCEVKKLILNGWPPNKNQTSMLTREYWNFREELTVQDGIILKNDRIVIPNKLRAEMIMKTHQGHIGINSSMRRARDNIFWPGMNAQIGQEIENCSICLSNSQNQVREPMKSHKIPNYPWERISLDIFEIFKQNYLIIVDHYSDFFEVECLENTTSEYIIECCKRQFSRYGIPQIIVSDNGRQFTSTEFQKFSKEWQFQHSTSSPLHSQGNGKAEAAVKIAKNLLKKSKHENVGRTFMGELGIDGILGLPGFRALKLHLSYDGSIRSDYERKEDPTKSAFLSSLQTIEMSPQPPRIPLNEIHTGHDIFRAFSHCFCNDIKDMGNGSTITAPKLRMLTSKPVYRRQYPIPNKLVSKVKALVDELEEVGIVEGSTSLWNSPLFPVAKTDGSVRITMDLRMINEATEFFPFPIPRVEDNLRAFAGAKVFSTLDLTSGFFQIHIPESDRDYFTFSLPWGRYRFTRLPQGAKNSAQVFQWAMNLVLGDLLFKCVRLYIDDVIVYSDSHEQHVADLAAVLERLSKFGLKAKYGKSYLFRDSVEYLGHVIDQNGIKPMWDNVAALRNLKRPHNIKAVRSLLGTVNYYRRFIPNAGNVAATISCPRPPEHPGTGGVQQP
ncbi:K02A2.6-like, partial [Cordylochernes scorpioides]